MADHKTGTREEWLEARLVLLEAEKEHTRRGDELALQRRSLPWVPVNKEYVFDTDEGERTLAELFAGRSQLLVYHFMFGPEWREGCPVCSYWADSFDGGVVHLAHRDVTMVCASRAPLDRLQAYKRRMGWSFPWVSSGANDFNYDYGVSVPGLNAGQSVVPRAWWCATRAAAPGLRAAPATVGRGIRRRCGRRGTAGRSAGPFGALPTRGRGAPKHRPHSGRECCEHRPGATLEEAARQWCAAAAAGVVRTRGGDRYKPSALR
jgi:Bacterial protein of unknown function (DUF899)